MGRAGEPESGTVLGTTLRSMQQPMRRISWAASLCLPLPVDKYNIFGKSLQDTEIHNTHVLIISMNLNK